MHLSRHLAQGRLLYFTQQQDAICVMENDHFRWLQFQDVVQSIMHKRCPPRLVLPHQIALLLPLAHFTPNSIAELGLGGGSTLRFIHQLSENIALTSVEKSQEIIDTFERYFQPEKLCANLVRSDANQWLIGAAINDWLICDIYSSISYKPTLFDNCWRQHIQQSRCFTLNLPNARSDEINTLLRKLTVHYPEKVLFYFDVPHYQNTVIHLLAPDLSGQSPLPKNKQLRWKKIWRQAHKLLPNNMALLD